MMTANGELEESNKCQMKGSFPDEVRLIAIRLLSSFSVRRLLSQLGSYFYNLRHKDSLRLKRLSLLLGWNFFF